jgi:hypothetical protein
MPIYAPIKITLYDPETDEIKKEYSRSFVPWRLLKRAISLSKNLSDINEENITPEDADAIASLVVDVFGDRFSVNELNDGADLGEMMTVLQAIIARAEGIVPNPPPLGEGK